MTRPPVPLAPAHRQMLEILHARPRPLDELPARTWQTIATAIDRYRHEHSIDDAEPHPLGPASHDARGAQRQRLLRLAAQLAPHHFDELDPSP